MENFKTGFKKGDTILHVNNSHITKNKEPRYINVWNIIDGKDYTIGDNGQRKERVVINGSLKFKNTPKGNMSYKEVIGNVFEIFK